MVPGALARTVNSLAFQVVTHAAVAQGQEVPTLLTGGEQDRIIADLLAGHESDGTGPDWPEPITAVVRERAGFRTALRDVMMRAVAAGIEPDEMRELGDETGHPEWRAVGDFVDGYRAALSAFRATSLDAAELVAYATAAVLRGQVPPAVAALRTVVVDDTQELVEGEIALLGALARSGVQVVAFGDPDIAASAFRGAVPDVLGRLGARLGVADVEQVVLGTVHRHAAPVRASSPASPHGSARRRPVGSAPRSPRSPTPGPTRSCTCRARAVRRSSSRSPGDSASTGSSTACPGTGWSS